MAFWNQAGEPLRQYRWYMVFGGVSDVVDGAPVLTSLQERANMDHYRYALKKVDKPKAKVNEITHKYLNHFFYYPGRLEWESINMTIAAVTNPSVDDALYNILINAGYQWPKNTNNDQLVTLSKKKFWNGLGSKISIVQVNSNGTKIEAWHLENPFFTSVQFGSLDYSSEEIVEIQCTLRYDRAIYDNAIDVTNDAADN